MTLEPGTKQRLRIVQGHLEAIHRMVEEERPCREILHQLSAVQGALEQVRRQLLEAYLHDCLHEALVTGNIDGLVDDLLQAT